MAASHHADRGGATNLRDWAIHAGRPIFGHLPALILILSVAPAGPSFAQKIPGPALVGGEGAAMAADSTEPDELAARLETVRGEIRELRASIDASSAKVEARHVAEVERRLRAIESLLERQAAARKAPPTQAADPDEETSAEAPSAYSMNRLYEALEELARLRAMQKELIDSTRAAVEETRAKLRDAETERRQARASLEQPEPRANPGDLERSLALRILDSRVAKEELRLREEELRQLQQRRSSDDAQERLLEEVQDMRSALASGEAVADSAFGDFLRRENSLRREAESARRELSSIELRIKALENQYASDPSRDPTVLARTESLAAERDAVRDRIELTESQADDIAAQIDFWRAWDALLTNELQADSLREIEAQIRERSELLEQRRLRLEVRIGAQDRTIDSLGQRLARLPADSPAREALRSHMLALERLRAQESGELQRLAEDGRAAARFASDLSQELGEVDPLVLLARARQGASDLWSYEITSVDDQPITVGSLILASFLIGVGLWASRRGSAFVGRVAEQRFSLDPGASDALQNLSFYVLFVGFGLMALRAIHFPLTAFTVLGGALAIGVGFGSQNVMNNFISGLILMLERPVRARDMVEVDGNHGVIERIGARSTQIRSTDGRHIIVPNSFFLENNVVNWTLSDDLIRTSVIVGVVYGSPTVLVEELIRRVVHEMAEILPKPAPIILFEEFGDNSLNFEVHFWVRARGPMETRKVSSKVRFAIDDLFREHEIVIAFPQRDVHLDSAKPIEVRVIDEERPAT